MRPDRRAWRDSASGTFVPQSDRQTHARRTLKRTELQHNESSIPGREIVQVLTDIPAGVESGWHTHPGEEVGCVLAGTVDMMIHGQPSSPCGPVLQERGRPALAP
jgi:quercetin dioxygenase-like cupin family protein